MSAMSERHHEQEPEPERPYTMDEWVTVRREAAKEAWAVTGMPFDYERVWRIADAVLRYAMPERVPTEEA